MNAIGLALVSLLGFAVAYFVYGRFLSEKIFALDLKQLTPAHEMEDGVDYVPANRYVLFGHHFASIAGLGPILGPAIAVIWGWVPALLWVTLGTIFFGAVHDLSALCISLKHQGRSISDITDDIIGPRSRLLFQIIIFFLLALAMGVFAITIAQLFTHKGGEWTQESQMYPQAIIPTFALMLIAMCMGYGVYKKKLPLGPLTLVGIALMLAAIWAGINNPFTALGRDTWVYILLGYAFLASVLPVWLLLQPRDYLNSFQLYGGLVLIFGGMLIVRPDIVAPAFNHADVPGLPPAYPFLFITIACGAISGFHNLVSSGTTARQIDKASDVTFIGYGGMLAEGILAVGVILACVAGVGSTAEWNTHYATWGSAAAGGLKGFIVGSGSFMTGLGIPKAWGQVLIATVAVSFAMTTLDSATRLLRYNIEELAKSFKFAPLQNPFVASLTAVIAIGFFALLKVDGRPAGAILWTLFGTTNQVLAMLGLLVVTVWLWRTGRPIIFTVIPMVYMTVTCSYAMLLNNRIFLEKMRLAETAADYRANLALLLVGSVIFLLAMWMVLEGLLVFWKMRGERALKLADATSGAAWRKRTRP